MSIFLLVVISFANDMKAQPLYAIIQTEKHTIKTKICLIRTHMLLKTTLDS